MKLRLRHRSLDPLTLLLLVLLCLAAHPGCGQIIRFCAPLAPMALPNGYNLQNGFWHPTGGSLCTDVDVARSTFVVRNTNSTPREGPPGSYSSLYVGCHFGTCSRNRENLPLQTNRIASATTSWSVTAASGGVWDISYDLWFHHAPTVAGQPNGQPDGAEIMILLNHQGGMQPAGQSTGQRVTVNGIAFTPWVAHQISLCGCGVRWNIVSYVADRPVSHVSNLDLQSFFADAIRRGELQSAWYLLDVEAGTEIWQDGNGFRSKAFSVAITPKQPDKPKSID